MDIVTNLEIHFHQQNEASVFLETNCSGDEEKFAERVLFCHYTLRQMANLGPGEVSNSLANLLYQTSLDSIKEFIQSGAFGEVRLVPYAGTPGRKRFEVSMIMGNSNFRFNLRPIGFGFLAKWMNYYAPTSVIVLLGYLCRKRKADTDYLTVLVKAAELCGRAGLEGGLNVRNQHVLANAVIGQVENYLLDSSEPIEPDDDPSDDPFMDQLHSLAVKMVESARDHTYFLNDYDYEFAQGISFKDVVDENNIVDIFCEFLFVFLSAVDRFAFAIFGEEDRGNVMDSLAYITRFVAKGLLGLEEEDADSENFDSYFMNTLNARAVEYSGHNLFFDQDGEVKYSSFDLGVAFGNIISELLIGKEKEVLSLLVGDLCSEAIDKLEPFEYFEKIAETV